MTQLQENTLEQMIGTLEDLSDFDAQRRYKKSVPFVHIPFELAAQWDNYTRLLDKNGEWFSPHQMLAIREFNLLLQKIEMESDFPDVEEVFEREDWMSVSEAAKILLAHFTQGGN